MNQKVWEGYSALIFLIRIYKNKVNLTEPVKITLYERECQTTGQLVFENGSKTFPIHGKWK